MQTLVQGCNALSGILLVWVLPRETAYAWFTVVSSMMVMVSLLSDSGMTSAANTLGGPIWQERARFTQVIAAVRRQQRWLTGFAVLIVVPWLVVLLQRLNTPTWVTGLAALAVVLFAWPMAAAQIFGNVNRLHARLRPQLLAELATSCTRLLLTVGVLVIAALAGWSVGPVFVGVVFAAVLSALLYYSMVERQAEQVLDQSPPLTGEFDSAIRRIAYSTAGFTVYYCLQGQLSLWLISWLGAAAQVADVGALSRLGLLFSLASGPLVQVVGPAFARSTDCAQLRRQLLQVCALYAVFAAAILLLVTLLPGPVLWLLGPQYGHLGAELPLAALGLTAAGYSGIIWGLVLARGWVKSSALIIPVGLAAQLAGVLIFDFSTVTGVLGFNLFITVPAVLLACVITARGFSRWKTQSGNGKMKP
ncbi:MAG: hypothetical protein ACKVY0_08225 [Prosthecobacter sp.]|uniref:hypothetical protein n=1 Tax=Prosthecobacter sp. TaxID=1965333 RepID=UPI0039040774